MTLSLQGMKGNPMWKLVTKDTGDEISVGDTLPDFRGDKHTVEGFDGMHPHKPSSSGKVMTDQGVFYPGVIGCEWVHADE